MLKKQESVNILIFMKNAYDDGMFACQYLKEKVKPYDKKTCFINIIY